MRKSIAYIVVIDLAFILVASMSAAVSGWAHDVVYFGLNILLIALAAALAGGDETSIRLSLLPRRSMQALALFAPSMLLIIGISFVISSLLALLGKSDVVDVSGPLLPHILNHALLPALFEEMIFRYVPIRLLGGRSTRAAIIVSSVMFALVHMSLFRIPYALVAGAIFAYITITTGSILPSILLHFANNTVSVLWMRAPETSPPIILIVLAALTLLSAVYIVIRRSDYLKSIREAFSGEKVGFSFEIAIAAVLCLGAALLELG